jgi:hypothetical protein
VGVLRELLGAGVARHFGGDPARHLDAPTLDRALRALPAPPRGQGMVCALVLRTGPGERHSPGSLLLRAGAGADGDAWERGRRDPLAAVSVMRDDVQRAMANGQDPALGGDNLRVALDLSFDALPAGALLRVGGALCRVSPKAHTGCRRFAARFGRAARDLPLRPDWAPHRLRGLFLAVIEGGVVAVGDPICLVAGPDPGAQSSSP